MARRFGSAMTSNTDSIFLIYPIGHILVKEYMQEASGNGARHQRDHGGPARGDHAGGTVRPSARPFTAGFRRRAGSRGAPARRPQPESESNPAAACGRRKSTTGVLDRQPPAANRAALAIPVAAMPAGVRTSRSAALNLRSARAWMPQSRIGRLSDARGPYPILPRRVAPGERDRAGARSRSGRPGKRADPVRTRAKRL